MHKPYVPEPPVMQLLPERTPKLQHHLDHMAKFESLERFALGLELRIKAYAIALLRARFQQAHWQGDDGPAGSERGRPGEVSRAQSDRGAAPLDLLDAGVQHHMHPGSIQTSRQ